MIINGAEKAFRGTLILVSSDNLASQLIGVYKCLASALRKCRFCMAIEEDIKSKVSTCLYQQLQVVITCVNCSSQMTILNKELDKHMQVMYKI